jgi:hypothetical protein
MSGLTVRDMESITLEAKAEVMQWREEFLREFIQPDMDLMIVMLWAKLSPEVKDQLAVRQPEAFKDFERQAKEARERMTNGNKSVR